MGRSKTILKVLLLAVGLGAPATSGGAATLRYIDQGPNWTKDKRALFYNVDQGSQLIPLAWFEALRQADDKPFLDGSLSRYGYLPTDDPAKAHNLPIGFTNMMSSHGPMAGISCAACHTREITAKGTTYRIDGGPANVDFVAFTHDLDAAMKRVREDDAVFKPFAKQVLGAKATEERAVQILRADVDLWWVRYHAFVSRSLPTDRPWGPSRMDAITLIYNRIAGLDIGPPPTYLIPGNIAVGHAPVRYPFLWNSQRQDITQWTGFAANGNEFYALTRNLGEEYGVFGTLHPQPTTGTFSILDRNYLIDNSANLEGLKASERVLQWMGPPAWPWPVDRALAQRGEAIFKRSPEAGGCDACHGIKPGGWRVNAMQPPWKTPVVDVGTDRQAWQVVLRRVDTGSMEGASLQGLVRPLEKRDTALAIVRAVVVGAIVEDAKAKPKVDAQEAKADNPKARIHAMAFDKLGLAVVRVQTAVKAKVGLGPPPPPPLVVNGYEARVLQGIWAAAPYLHNGSVPSLTELLKPPTERVKSFKLGPEYDPTTVGLAANQTWFDFTLKTTGCDDLLSGDSNCGHEYGTHLAPEEKTALIEYLKTL